MDIIEFLQKGGTIVYLLIVLNIIGFSIIFAKLYTLYNFKKNIQTNANNIAQNTNTKNDSYIDTVVQNEIKKLESGLNTIKIIATISPLLGLLGTVIGIFSSFETISKVGLDDPMLFSGGISLALITTVVGLTVAIPHYIFYNYFIGSLDKQELVLKQKVIENI
jgi:biopolymer transport protein ExbB